MFFKFNSSNVVHYVFAFTLIMAVSYVGNMYKKVFSDKETDENDIIRKYLLNESPLYGYNRPKLWIHTKYEYNSRRWKSFGSRSSTELNQPFIHLCIKSIIGHCGEDFNIILIDDNAFSKLIPNWDIDNISTMADPLRARIRNLGMANLLYLYGGIVVPNTFVCSRNLTTLYENAVGDGIPFICENINKSVNIRLGSRANSFTPDPYFMGSTKNCPIIQKYIEYLKRQCSLSHVSSDEEFLGSTSQWFLRAIDAGNILLVSGCLVGVKDQNRRPILIDNLFEEEYLQLSEDTYGLYLPGEDILTRSKYKWFAYMSEHDVMLQHSFICKFIAAAIVESIGEYPSQHASGEIRNKSVLAI